MAPNLNQPDFVPDQRPEGFKSKRARIGHQLGSERIGCSLFEVPPSQAAYPYHFHLGDEELIIVLSGCPSLRTPEGTRQLAEGDAIRFPVGEEGAHQLFNASEEPVTFLAISSSGHPDLVVYPDSGKIGVSERLPQGGGLMAMFKDGDQVSYWDGEQFPP